MKFILSSVDALRAILLFSLGVSLAIPIILPVDTKSETCQTNGANWKYKEIINIQARKRIITTNTCPNHYSVCQNKECSGDYATLASSRNMYYEIPLYPMIAEVVRDTLCLNDTIAIALNGVSILSMKYHEPICQRPLTKDAGQSINDRTCSIIGDHDATKVCGDAVYNDANTFDKCGGHTNDDGLYHYHVPPACLINQLNNMATKTNTIVATTMENQTTHSPQIGWALDGFPVYGPYGPNGNIMLRCEEALAHPVFCLDPCNGLFHELDNMDGYTYRYYVTGDIANEKCSSIVDNALKNKKCERVNNKCCASVIPSPVYKPYTPGCFKGCLVGERDCRNADTRGTTKEFTPKVSKHPTSTYFGISPPPSLLGPGDESSPPEDDQVDTADDTTDRGDEDTFRYKDLYDETVVRLQDGRSIGILSSTSSSVVSLPSSPLDAFVTSIALGHRGDSESSSRLVYTTQRGIFSMLESGEDIKTIVKSIHKVLIEGYNFGSSVSDILSVSVRYTPCATIYLHTDSPSSNKFDIKTRNTLQTITCYLTTVEQGDIFSVDDVVVSTVYGSYSGVHLQPLTVASGLSHRTVISKISFDEKPFRPYGLAYYEDSLEGDSDYVYWSDLQSKTISRCRVNSLSYDILLENLPRVYGLHIISKYNKSSLGPILFFLDSERGYLVAQELSFVSDISSGRVTLRQVKEIVLLKGLEEPRSISSDLVRGYMYVTVFGGGAFKLKIGYVYSRLEKWLSSTLTSPNSSEEDCFDVRGVKSTSFPNWLSTAVHRYYSTSRFDGIGVLASRITQTSDYLSNVKYNWLEQHIIVVDTTTNDLVLTTEDAVVSSRVNLYRSYTSSSAVLWPRSIAVRWSYNDTFYTSSINTTLPCDTAVVYVGEYLGKIWKININICLDRIVQSSVIGAPKLIVDLSKFSSGIEVRKKLINGHLMLPTNSAKEWSILPNMLD